MTPDPGLTSWLQLTLTPGLGAATLRGLLTQFGLPENVLSARRAELARFASAEALQALDSSEVAKSVEHSPFISADSRGDRRATSAGRCSRAIYSPLK